MAFSSREVVEGLLHAFVSSSLPLPKEDRGGRETVEVRSAFKRAIAKHSEKEDLSRPKKGEVAQGRILRQSGKWRFQGAKLITDARGTGMCL